MMLKKLNIYIQAGAKLLHTSVLNARAGIKDFLFSVVPQVASQASNLVFSIFLAKALGPSAVGQYNLILSIPLFVITVSDLGVTTTAVRFASRAARSENYALQQAILNWASRVRLVIVSLELIVAFLILPWLARQAWHAEQFVSLMRLGLLLPLLNVFTTAPNIYFQTLRRFRASALFSSLQATALFVGAIVLTLSHAWQLAGAVTLPLLAALVMAVAGVLMVPRPISTFWCRHNEAAKKTAWQWFWHPPAAAILGESKNFALKVMFASVIGAIYLRLDVWLIGHFLGYAEQGIYAIATRPSAPLAMITAALGTVLWPRISALTSPRQTRLLLRKALLLSVPVILAIGIYSLLVPYLIPLVFGKAFTPAIHLSQLLCLRYSLAFLLVVVSAAGYNYGLVHIYWLVNLAQLLVTALAFISLVPALSAFGAALALIMGEFVSLSLISSLLLYRIKMTGTSQ